MSQSYSYFSIISKQKGDTEHVISNIKQAGAELCQAQLELATR